jgi:hypothetical protein
MENVILKLRNIVSRINDTIKTYEQASNQMECIKNEVLDLQYQLERREGERISSHFQTAYNATYNRHISKD